MSYAVVEDVAASWESYELIAAELERSRPDGLILHAAGRTDEGIRIVEVWESEEAWRRFAGEDASGDGRFRGAPRFVRDFELTHLVVGGDVSQRSRAHEGGPGLALRDERAGIPSS